MTRDSGLTDKVAIVTGAAGDIGFAYARGLADAGATVVLADRNLEGAAANAEVITAAGGRARAQTVDLLDGATIEAMVTETVERYGGLDILVNNAALMSELPQVPLAEFPLDWWERLLAVNVTGTLLCSQVAAPAMANRGGGSIINQSSAGAYALSGAYSVTKLAIIGLTVVLAKDLGKHMIRVNAIAPGIVDTAAGKLAAPPNLIEKIDAVTPLHALGQPEELVGALLFLASNASGWMTGQCLSVDGGWITRI